MKWDPDSPHLTPGSLVPPNVRLHQIIKVRIIKRTPLKTVYNVGLVLLCPDRSPWPLQKKLNNKNKSVPSKEFFVVVNFVFVFVRKIIYKKLVKIFASNKALFFMICNLMFFLGIASIKNHSSFYH